MKNDRALNVIVVGAGMYVSGRDTAGYGTILPSLYQGVKDGIVGKIKIAATNPASIKELNRKVGELNTMFGFAPAIESFPQKEADSQAYKKATESGWKPDCAIISVPDHLHAEVAAYFLGQGIHCLVVKPLAPTVAEVKKLIDLQIKNKLYGAVEFHKRFDRSNLKLRDAIHQGKIGEPLYFIVEYSQRKSIPLEKFRSWVKQTNIFQYLGVHYVDIIYFATGAVPKRVMAVGQKKYLASQGVDTYDSIQTMVEWETAAGGKFVSAIHTNWIDPEKTSAMSDQRIKVIGTQGRFEADQKDRGISLVTDEGGIEEPNPDFSSFYGKPGGRDFSFQGYGNDSITRFLLDASDIISGRIASDKLEDIRPTFKQSLIPTAVVEAVNQSLQENGNWVKVIL